MQIQKDKCVVGLEWSWEAALPHQRDLSHLLDLLLQAIQDDSDNDYIAGLVDADDEDIL